jgi:hypothetical protein
MNQLLQCCANLATYPLLGIFVIKPRLELLSLACHNDISSQEFCVLVCHIIHTMM